jgi:hypothetical protein
MVVVRGFGATKNQLTITAINILHLTVLFKSFAILAVRPDLQQHAPGDCQGLIFLLFA